MLMRVFSERMDLVNSTARAVLCYSVSPPGGNLKVSQRLVVVVKDGRDGGGGVDATCYLERPLWDLYLFLSLTLMATRKSSNSKGSWDRAILFMSLLICIFLHSDHVTN